ncbi:MAG: hypothetical protein M3Z83_07010 [Actinomycetota bacterium]|nr:hypothetical protein [Actinomycetota bacterium]
MRAFPFVLAAAATGATLSLVTASAAGAASAPTPVTFAVAVGTLSISAPIGSVSLGTNGVPGGTLSLPLGTVTVTDARAGTTGWLATVDTVAWVGPSQTIPKTAMTYLPGTATLLLGQVAVVTPGSLTPVAFGGSALTAQTANAVVGNNTAGWNPTLSVAIPGTALAGTYSGTVTHSVL